MKIFIRLLIIMSTITQLAYAQGRVITGVVSGKEGPLAGATVTEKAFPANATATDNEGRFTITLKGPKAVLLVGSVGYATRELTVSASNTITTKLEEQLTNLDDVVVVGYGKQKKITLTGAASSVTGESIRQNASASLQNTLMGKLPGYTSQQRSGRPGGDGAEFFIRGQSTFAGNNAPLIIVDDIEFSYDQFQRIDPNEIESLTILKDASTTAIYGVRGANGVVVVNTRRGAVGRPQITVRNEFSLMQPTKFPEYLNAYDAARLFREAQINDNANLPSPAPNYKPYFSEDDVEKFRTHSSPYTHPDNNWRDILFKQFSNQNRVNVDVSGGSDRVKYFVSAGYLYQGGILKDFSKGEGYDNNYFNKRINYRSNLDITVTNNLNARVDLSGNVSEINTPRVGSPFNSNDVFWEIGQWRSLTPFNYPIYNEDGSFGYSYFQQSFGANYNNNMVNNIVGRLKYFGYNRSFENNMALNATLTQKLDFITPGLSARGVLAYSSAYGYGRSLTRDNFPSFVNDTIAKAYIPRDPAVLRVPAPGLGYSPNSTLRVLNAQLQLNYDHSIGHHHLTILALANQNTRLAASGNVIYNFVPANFRGLTGRINYDYKQKYLLSLVSAYNGSDRFAEGNQYGFFPAVSVGWNLSRENFFKSALPFVDQFKIRGSYGMVGNDKFGNADYNNLTYYYLQTYNTGNGVNGYAGSFGTTDNGFTGISEGQMANPVVTWEKQKEYNLGIDLGLFNKITASIDVFRKDRYDILFTRGSVSSLFGQTLPVVNIGKVKNIGMEAQITYRDVIGDNFRFSIGGNFSYVKNTIVYQDEAPQMYPWMAFTGKSIGAIRVYQYEGFYNDKTDIANSPATPLAVIPGDLKFADLNGDNKIDAFDQYVSEYANFPRIVYGIPLNFEYRNFSVNLLFQGAAQFNVRGIAEQIQAFSTNLQPIHLQAWTTERGNQAKYPVLSYVSRISDPRAYPADFWYRRGDYIRLRNAEIAYNVPGSLLKRFRVQGLRIYANGTNLLLWSKLDNLYQVDPEVSSGSDRVPYPPQRMFNFGLSLSF
jgi:TonB-linked SusC/RagA family outer membrane protein